MTRIGFILLMLTMATGLLCLSACSSKEVTPGYTLFQGESEELSFSLEYPDTWSASIEAVGQMERLYLRFSKSFVFISSFSHPDHRGGYDDVTEFIRDKESKYKYMPEFQVLSSGKITLDNVVGQEVSLSYHQTPGGPEAPASEGDVLLKVVAVD